MDKKQHNLVDVVEFCRENKLPGRIVGRWVWIKFDAKPVEEIRHNLIDYGFRWSRRRGQWAHNCGHTSKPARSYRPWDKYQTQLIESEMS